MKTWLPFELNEGSPLFGREDDVIAFPVVSADSDHRLLSLQPFGLLR